MRRTQEKFLEAIKKVPRAKFARLEPRAQFNGLGPEALRKDDQGPSRERMKTSYVTVKTGCRRPRNCLKRRTINERTLKLKERNYLEKDGKPSGATKTVSYLTGRH